MTLDTTDRASSAGHELINRPLLRAAVKVNTWMFALVFGVLGGIFLMSITYASMLRGLPYPGHYMNLLGVFLPGYSVSPAGAWIGLFWGALLGGAIGALIYRIYARGIEAQVVDYINDNKTRQDLLSAKLLFDGNALGLALGTVVGGGLLLTTNWLVLRGTADESINASLLSNYLPGYTVSPGGSFIGAVQLFALMYLVCRLFAWIYNSVAIMRGGNR
jgi:hypothetical protein